jgi:hypothetical protein
MENLLSLQNCGNINSSYTLEFLYSLRPHYHFSRCARRALFCFRLWKPSSVNCMIGDDNRMASLLSPVSYHTALIVKASLAAMVSLRIIRECLLLIHMSLRPQTNMSISPPCLNGQFEYYQTTTSWKPTANNNVLHVSSLPSSDLPPSHCNTTNIESNQDSAISTALSTSRVLHTSYACAP